MKRSVALVVLVAVLASVVALAGCSSRPKGSIPANAAYDKQQANEAILSQLDQYASGVNSIPALVASRVATGADIKQMGQNIDTIFKAIEQTAADRDLDIKGLTEAHTALSDAIQGVNDSAPARDEMTELTPKVNAVKKAVASLKKQLTSTPK